MNGVTNKMSYCRIQWRLAGNVQSKSELHVFKMRSTRWKGRSELCDKTDSTKEVIVMMEYARRRNI
jgi:hypothetical protein